MALLLSTMPRTDKTKLLYSDIIFSLSCSHRNLF